MNELHQDVNPNFAVDFLLYYQWLRHDLPASTAHQLVAYQATLMADHTIEDTAQGTICWEFSDGSTLLRDSHNSYASYPKGHHV